MLNVRTGRKYQSITRQRFFAHIIRCIAHFHDVALVWHYKKEKTKTDVYRDQLSEKLVYILDLFHLLLLKRLYVYHT